MSYCVLFVIIEPLYSDDVDWLELVRGLSFVKHVLIFFAIIRHQLPLVINPYNDVCN